MEQLVSEFTPDTHLPPVIMGARLMGSVLLGAAIGFEREWQHRSAGLRTHILVCLAAATVAILTVEVAHMEDFGGDEIRVDPIRLVEAVTAGVAFLAAGLIVFAGGRVFGLTTGAGLWLAGSVGLATGLGQWIIALPTTLLAVVVLWLVKRFEVRLIHRDDQLRTQDEERRSDRSS